MANQPQAQLFPPLEPADLPAGPSPSSPGIEAVDHIGEACRKILRYHFQIMVDNDAGSRRGEDIAHVHDMRVATRRMRAAFRLLGSYFRRRQIRPFQEGLRQTGRTLGAVRDLDVFNKKAQAYLRKQGKDHDLTPLLEHWHAERELALASLIDHLDSDLHQQFVSAFWQFLSQEGIGIKPLKPDAAPRCQVRHVLTSTLWELYENVRSYETRLEDADWHTLHALRIECKRLRYALEFFLEVLGPGTSQLIKEVIAVQDHLGDIQDAVVAAGLLRDFQAALPTEPEATADSSALAGIMAYRAFREQEAVELDATFPQVWPRVGSKAFRRQLAMVLEDL